MSQVVNKWREQGYLVTPDIKIYEYGQQAFNRQRHTSTAPIVGHTGVEGPGYSLSAWQLVSMWLVACSLKPFRFV